MTLCSGSAPGSRSADQRVPGLVVGDRLLLALGDDHRAPLDAHQDLVLGVLEVDHLDDLLVLARGEERRLVDQVGQIGAREARRAAREHLEVDIGRQRDPPRVDREDLLPPLDVGPRHHHLAVEAAGTEQRGVEHVGRLVAAIRITPSLVSKPSISTRSWFSVCSRSSWPPPSPAPRCRPTASISSMKMMQGACFLPCSKRSRTRRGADADEHLDEVRARDREERHVGLAGDGLGEQRLARAGRPARRTPFGIFPQQYVVVPCASFTGQLWCLLMTKFS